MEKLNHNKPNIIPKIAIILLTIFLITSFISFFYPGTLLDKMLTYYNSLSSLVLVMLTLLYVITTNRQLTAMVTQLQVMEKSINLQVQPLPIPEIKNLRLEKIRAFLGPADHFKVIHVMYRLTYDVEFKNEGSGSALNLALYSKIISEKSKKEFISLPIPNQIPCVGNNSNVMPISPTIIDKDYQILKDLVNSDSVKLDLEIYYKNIFGAGFYIPATYNLRVADNDKELAKRWFDFLNDGVKIFEKDFIRYTSLIDTVPEDAHNIFDNIKVEMEKQFNSDLNLTCMISAKSFDVELTDYQELRSQRDAQYRALFDQIYKFKTRSASDR